MSQLIAMPVTSAQELLSIALELHNDAVQSNSFTDAGKVYPQFNREKSLYAYACKKLFNSRKDLTEEEKQKAREYVRPLNDGFRRLMQEMLDIDVVLNAKYKSEAGKEALFFERAAAYLESNGKRYQLALKNIFLKKEQKVITSIAFIPLDNKPALGTPQATTSTFGAGQLVNQVVPEGI